MHKLKLSIESLNVQSFDTAPLLPGRGTVDGRGGLAGDFDPQGTSPKCEDTPLASCDARCQDNP